MPSINKGLDYEKKLITHLHKHGLMSKREKGAGASPVGHDFHLLNKTKGIAHPGKAYERATGESKVSTHAAFGQMSVHYDHDAGKWGIHPKIRALKPEFASAVDHATVGGKPLMDHVNQTMGRPSKIAKPKGDIYSDKTDLSPVHAYLKDHHVDVLHVGTHGTFRAGDRDATGVGFPKAKGEGSFRLRQKGSNPAIKTIQFNVNKLEKSHINLENDEHLQHIKQVLGH